MAVLPQIATSAISVVAGADGKTKVMGDALIAVHAAWRNSAAFAGPWIA